jgi:Sulfotransferase domain
LLDRVLGQIPDFVSVGEIREIWRSGCIENRDCGCGRPFHECPFWTEVGQEAFGGWNGLDLDDVIRLRYSLDRGWMTPLLAMARKPPSISRSIERYVAYLVPLYQAIHRVSGAKVIIDSSNLASHALLVRMIPGIDLKIAHLVRDSRGVAFSWTKAIARHVTEEGTRYMPRYNAMASSLRWSMYNGLASSLHRLDLPQQTLRYEDLMRSPKRQVRMLAEFAGASTSELTFMTDDSVNLGIGHTVDGNSMRFRLGDVPLRKDEEWRSKMSRLSRWTVTAVTLPLLARYGYVGFHEKSGV